MGLGGRRQEWRSQLLITILLHLLAGLHGIRPRIALQAQPADLHSMHSTMEGLTVPASGGKAGSLRVVVVNDISGHLEVLGCLLHMLRGAGIKPTTLYTGPRSLLHSLGMFEWLGLSTETVSASLASSMADERASSFGYDLPGLGHFHNMPGTHQVAMPDGLAADLVICITPELARGECSQVIAALKPSYLVTWVHRGDMVNSLVYSMYPRQALVALSPHVASACEEATGVTTDWALPIAPFIDEIEPCNSLSCLSGFVMQGTIRSANGPNSMLGRGGHTRDYRTLWSRLTKLHRTHKKAVSRMHVTVLGRGHASHLEVPTQLADHVTHQSGLPYPEFWRQIHRSLALLPCFGTETYYTSRLSSTITASLITSTPLIADRRLLETYTFLKEEHVFLQRDGEDEAAAMLRITRMSEEEVLSRRRALVKLRQSLNQRSQTVLTKWLDVARAIATPDKSGRGAALMLPSLEEAETLRQQRRAELRRARQTRGMDAGIREGRGEGSARQRRHQLIK